MRRDTKRFAVPSAALLALLGGFAARPADAAPNRLILASQSDFGAKRGFYLNLENDAPDGQPCRLATLRLFLGVADGKNWRFPNFAPPQGWQYGREYSVRAVIAPGGASELFLDGQRVATSTDGGPLATQAGPLTAAETPDWASGPAEYLIRETALSVESGTQRLSIPFSPPGRRPMPIYLFSPDDYQSRDGFQVTPGAPLVVNARFRLERYPSDLKAFGALVDRYGQNKYADWPGKVRTDADLGRALRDEEGRERSWGKPAGYDAYGGLAAAPWHEAPTGFYRTVRHGGKWWLVSPAGNPTFYSGICDAPAAIWEMTPVTGRESLFAELPPQTGATTDLWKRGVWGDGADVAYVALQGANLMRKFGANRWSVASDDALIRRAGVWGFSGLAKWCGPVGKLPFLSVLGADGVPKLARHPDIFDPAVRDTFTAALRRQIEPRRGDPTLLGWSFGNEYDEIITRDEIRDVLKNHADSPAAHALSDEMARTVYGGDAAKRDTAWKTAIPDADVEAMRRFYADRYYGFLYNTIKQIDPNHLYFGFWIVPGWWENEEDWRLIAPHCDVIGYDRYAKTFTDEMLTRLMRQTDKPIFCGEFSFPPYYDGMRAFGRYGPVSVRDEAEAGEYYTRWMHDAAVNPYCVGVAWFEYRDEPITGRGPGHGPALVYGEHYAFGLVDVTDIPKWDLITRVRAANLKAVQQRLAP